MVLTGQGTDGEVASILNWMRTYEDEMNDEASEETTNEEDPK